MSFLFGRSRRQQPVVYAYQLRACRVCRCRDVNPQDAASMGYMPIIPVEQIYPQAMQYQPFGRRYQYGYGTSMFAPRGRRVRPFY